MLPVWGYWLGSIRRKYYFLLRNVQKTVSFSVCYRQQLSSTGDVQRKYDKIKQKNDKCNEAKYITKE